MRLHNLRDGGVFWTGLEPFLTRILKFNVWCVSTTWLKLFQQNFSISNAAITGTRTAIENGSCVSFACRNELEPLIFSGEMGIRTGVLLVPPGCPHTCPHSGDTTSWETVPCLPALRPCFAGSRHPRLLWDLSAHAHSGCARAHARARPRRLRENEFTDGRV
jgi:hypothetical protein